MFDWVKQLFASNTPTAAPTPAPAATAAPLPAAPAAAVPAARPAVQIDQRDAVDENFYDWLFVPEADNGLDLTPAEEQALAGLQAILQGQQSGAALVRRMPGLIPQLMQSLRSDTFSGAQLSKMISNDVVLVAAVTRLANSSFLNTGTQINSVEHAVIVIGQEGLRQLITTVAFRPIIDVNSGPYTRMMAARIWEQSERCAVACRTLAPGFGLDPFEAFLAGLLQSVGLIVSLRIMDQADKEGKALGSPLFIGRLLPITRQLAASIGKEWDLPPAVIQAVSEQGVMRRGMVMSPLGQLLSLGDYLAKVKLLVEAERLGAGDPRLFKGLSEEAIGCFADLQAPQDA